MMNIKALCQFQRELADQIALQDSFSMPKLIAGADVGFEQQGKITRGAIAVLRYPQMDLVEYKIVRINTNIPYIPGLLAFRECPCLLNAWQQLENRPPLVLVDGHGIAHPRRLGIASHFGLSASVSTIGVAKKRLYGQIATLSTEQNSTEPIYDNTQQIGWGWRSKIKCHPLYISPGHGISLSSALLWVQRCTRGYRLPEPLRWADAIASNKVLFKRYMLMLNHK